MIYKNGVQRDPVHPEMYYARGVADVVFRQEAGREAVCTDSVRSPTPGGSSLHPLGLADDYRTKDLDTATQRHIRDRVRYFLPDTYDVVLEGPASEDVKYQHRVAHLHVELDVQ